MLVCGIVAQDATGEVARASGGGGRAGELIGRSGPGPDQGPGRASKHELATSGTGITYPRSSLVSRSEDLSSDVPIDFVSPPRRTSSRNPGSRTSEADHRFTSLHFPSNLTGVTDVVLLQAAILHDVLEDTDSSYDELKQEFGQEVADVVMVRPHLICSLSGPFSAQTRSLTLFSSFFRISQECTDDTELTGPARKRAQVETAAGKSKRAR